jgi:hypothetical protein
VHSGTKVYLKPFYKKLFGVEADKLKGERNRRNQSPESQFKKSGTFTLLTVIVSLKGIESDIESFRAKY